MARAELAERKAFGYPPYSHLMRFMLRNKDYTLLHQASHAMATLLRQKFGSRVMGPVSAALEMLRGEHRSEILLKIESGASMKLARKLVREVLAEMTHDSRFKGVTITTDVDAW
jgi:primosomal protein N' (replication factor Y)